QNGLHVLDGGHAVGLAQVINEAQGLEVRVGRQGQVQNFVVVDVVAGAGHVLAGSVHAVRQLSAHRVGHRAVDQGDVGALHRGGRGGGGGGGDGDDEVHALGDEQLADVVQGGGVRLAVLHLELDGRAAGGDTGLGEG